MVQMCAVVFLKTTVEFCLISTTIYYFLTNLKHPSTKTFSDDRKKKYFSTLKS